MLACQPFGKLWKTSKGSGQVNKTAISKTPPAVMRLTVKWAMFYPIFFKVYKKIISQ